MAPACILLDRTAVFRDHPQEPEPEPEPDRCIGATNAALPKPLSFEATEAAVARYLRAMKPDLQFLEPPGASLDVLYGMAPALRRRVFLALHHDPRYPRRVHWLFQERRPRDRHNGTINCDCEEDEVGSSLSMSFVPLPHGLSLSAEEEPRGRWANQQDFRNVACVDGTIKFLAMDPGTTPMSVVTYALDLDEPSSPVWMKDTVLRVEDLWAGKKFVSMDVPRVTPVFPVLSTQEHDVVHLAIPGDLELEDGFRVRRVRLLLSVDTRKARVISANQPKHPPTVFSLRDRLAFSFDASQPQSRCSKHHQAHNDPMESASLPAMEKDRLLPVPTKSCPSSQLENELFVKGGRDVITGVKYQRRTKCRCS